MIEAGESGGMLDGVLDRLASMLERNHALRRRVLASLTYPALVLVAALVLIVFLLVTIVPTFDRMFSQMNIPIPATTLLLMRLGATLANPTTWIIAGATVAVGAFAAAASSRREWFRRTVDYVRFGLPITGPIARRASTALIARTLASLLRSGVDILRATDIVTPLTRSGMYTRALDRLALALREGESISDPLERSGAFDAFTIAMIRVGEESGSLDTMLEKVADHYESEVEAAMLALGATVEPALIFFVGLIVAGIVFSVFIPMYSLVGQIH
jgi:type IV pilus assembly protein PilC